MATFDKILFSASGGGEPILIAATTTPGTNINTQAAGSQFYEVWAWASNIHTLPVTLTIEWNGTGAANKQIVTIPSQEGLFQIIPGLPIVGSATFKAFASVTNVINIWGFINKITP